LQRYQLIDVVPLKTEYTEFGGKMNKSIDYPASDFRNPTQEEKDEARMLVKDTNPKDAVGIKKGPITTVSGPVMAELGVAMLEGARKYGRHNYRVAGVRASVYRDATWRHLAKWWAGQDIDPDSGVHHLVKALASIMVLRDAQLFDKCDDDRPPALPRADEFWANIDKMSVDLIKKHPNPKAPFTQKGLEEEYE
jgi:hypothetical protein